MVSSFNSKGYNCVCVGFIVLRSVEKYPLLRLFTDTRGEESICTRSAKDESNRFYYLLWFRAYCKCMFVV